MGLSSHFLTRMVGDLYFSITSLTSFLCKVDFQETFYTVFTPYRNIMSNGMRFFLALSVIPHAMPSYVELRTRKETFAFKLVRYPICVCSLIQTAFFLCLLTNQYGFRTVKMTGSLKDLNWIS